MQTRGVLFEKPAQGSQQWYLRTLQVHCRARGPIIMDGTTNNLDVVLKKYQKFDGKNADDFLNGFPSFVPVSASTTEPKLTSCTGKSDRRRPTTVMPLPVRRRVPPTRIYSAYYCSFRRATQPSSSYRDSRAPHSRMEQDMGTTGVGSAA